MNQGIDSSVSIWFWQCMVSPHMVSLADSLACSGFDVVFVANEKISEERAEQGWTIPHLSKVKIFIAKDIASIRKIILSAPRGSIHICQGFRGNGLVNSARQILYKHGMRQWVVMEGVDDSGVLGIVKRIIYRLLLNFAKNKIDGILAIGDKTASWLAKRGYPKEKIYKFAYFLRDDIYENNNIQKIANESIRSFRFIYVGQLIERKCVDFLISTVASLKREDIEVWVFGSGKLESSLRSQAAQVLPDKVRWFGVRTMPEIHTFIAMADCLILPSRHDGWGAVISEALMIGTPVICSDSCGGSVVVHASNVGSVFPVGDQCLFKSVLLRQYESGQWGRVQRSRLAYWAKCLGAKAGAEYLIRILKHNERGGDAPIPPWSSLDNP
jgi:glycosyltransferase involved in cell wall biosynthesis